MVRRRLVGLERNREEETRLGVEQVAAVGIDLRQDGMRLADLRVERECLPRRLFGHLEVALLVALFLGVPGQDDVRRGERRVRPGKRRIARKRGLVQVDGARRFCSPRRFQMARPCRYCS